MGEHLHLGSSSNKTWTGEETTSIWKLKGWGKDEDFRHLQNSSFLVDIGPRASGNKRIRKNSKKKGSQARLRFFFQEHSVVSNSHESELVLSTINYESDNGPVVSDYVTERGNIVTSWHDKTHWLSLNVEVETGKFPKLEKLELKVESVNHNYSSTKYVEPTIKDITYPNREDESNLSTLLKSDFIKLSEYRRFDLKSFPFVMCSPAMVPVRPRDLWLKISVTPTFASPNFNSDDEDDDFGHDTVEDKQTGEVLEKVLMEATDDDAILLGQLKDFFISEENYPDLNLEMKYGVMLSSHKFMLAARSPVLRDLIEKAVKNNDFDGTIQLLDIDAKPMMVLLRWICTAELHENAVKYMEEVLDASIKFELTGLTKILDKKMISICNTGNMFQLYHVANVNGMPVATADIAKFIKENISEVPTPSSSSRLTEG